MDSYRKDVASSGPHGVSSLPCHLPRGVPRSCLGTGETRDEFLSGAIPDAQHAILSTRDDAFTVEAGVGGVEEGIAGLGEGGVGDLDGLVAARGEEALGVTNLDDGSERLRVFLVRRLLLSFRATTDLHLSIHTGFCE